MSKQPVERVGTGEGGAGGMAQSLRALRRRAKSMLLVQGVGLVLAMALGVVLAAGLADFFLRMPSWLRMAAWVGGVIGLVAAVRRLVWPAALFAPSLTEVALRIERSEAGAKAGLAGLLAAGLELAGLRQRGEPGSRMAAPVIEEAGKRFRGVSGAAVLTGARMWRSVGLLALAALAAGAVWDAQPRLARIGAARVLAPWTGAQWPKRTEVADATQGRVHALGTAMALRAALVRNEGALGLGGRGREAVVVGRYRLVTDGVAGPVRRVVLTSQEKDVQVGGDVDEQTGAATPVRVGVLYEQLIDPTGLEGKATVGAAVERGARPAAGGAKADAPGVMELEYWFETQDDRTEARRVLLVEPPTVVGAVAKVELPAYALSDAPTGGKEIALGAGNDDRGAAGALLAGSRVRLTIEMNKPVPGAPEGPGMEPGRVKWINAALGTDLGRLAEEAAKQQGTKAATEEDGSKGATGEFRATFEGARWEVEWVLRESVRVPVHVRDEHGIEGAEEAVYRFDVMEDRPPSAAVTEPAEDQSVLPTAAVDLKGEGRDDVGLAWVALERQRARAPKGSAGAPADPIEGLVEIGRVEGEAARQRSSQAAEAEGEKSEGARAMGAPDVGSAGGVTRLEYASHLELAGLGVEPGDEVWLTARAADAYDLDGKTHDPVRSTVRRLRIISPEELVSQVWAELGAVRHSAIRIDEQQVGVQQEVTRGGEAQRLERAQSGISDQVARQRQTLERLTERVKQNGLKDAPTDTVLADASRLLDEAGKASVQASNQLDKAGKADKATGQEEQSAKDRAEALKAQEDVRGDLADLIGLLDQGEDTWATKRAIERVLREQKELRERTRQAAQQTTGKSPDDLGEEERKELDDIAKDQQSTAQRAAAAIQKMMEQEPKMRQKDPAAAQAMADAARRGQREQVPQRMEQAAEQVKQNQTHSAQAQQDRAIQAMEQMLDDLRQAGKNRDEILRRELASLIESITALIAQQEAHLASLGAAREAGDLKGLDGPMAGLYQNTVGVAQQAGKGARELAPVADLLVKAADAQEAAVVALRDSPTNADEVQGQEDLSLSRLKQAKEEAERLDREAAQRQAQRKRAELKKAYSEALAEQVAIRQETEPLVGAEATRRIKATARTVGQKQGGVQEKLAGLRAQTKELTEAVMFDYAHTRLDEAMGAAAAKLGEGDADRAVTRHQDHAVRILRSLIAALDEQKKKDDEFRDRPNGGQGSGAGGKPSLIPPIAELRLLRSMEEEAADMTKAAAEAGAGDEDVQAAGKLQGDLAQRAQEMIKKLQQQQQPGGARPGGKPGDAGGGGGAGGSGGG